MGSDRKVTKLSEYTDDTLYADVPGVLDEAARDFAPGGAWEDRDNIFVFTLRRGSGAFDVRHNSAGLTCTDVILACRILEARMLRYMGESLGPGDIEIVD